MSLRNIAFGTAAMSSANVLRLLVQSFAVPILARHLSPFDYGVVGMAMPILAFTKIIADAGIGMSLMRSSASEREEWSTCFWLSVFLGIFLAALMCATAPVASLLLRESLLAYVIMALGLVVLFQAVVIIPTTMLQQRQQFNNIAAIEITAIIISIGAAVLIARRGGGAWALVGQQLSYSVVKLIVTFILSPFRPLIVLNLHSVIEHLTFSRDILITNIVRFLTTSIDNLIIGYVLGAAAVGIYSMTWQFVSLPIMLVAGPLQYVLFAQLTRIKHDRAATQRLYLILTRGLATIAFPAIGMIAVAHVPIFSVILSNKWATSGVLFLNLAPMSAILTVTTIGATIVLALGRTDIQLRAAAEFGIIWVVTMVAVVWFGLKWFTVAYSVATLVYAPRWLMLVLPLVGCSARAYIRALAMPMVATIICILAYLVLTNLVYLDYLLQLCSAGILGIAGVIIGGLLQRSVLHQEITLWRGKTMGRVGLAI